MKSQFGFNTDKYLKAQKQAIEERLSHFSGRLYLEFGGKLLQDFHAARTLPGYDPDAKLTLLKSLKKQLGILYCISAKQLSNGKIRGDLGIGYDLATLKALETLQKNKLPLLGVVINRYQGEVEADNFERRLKNMGIAVYKRKEIAGYPCNLDTILSDKGYGADDYIETDKSLVIVWGAGPGSGKLSTCLGQIYLDEKHSINSGYAKFETFPVWDLPLDHPVNIAYEAATADLGDFNLIDPFHLKAHQKQAVNYNRDVEAFPIIKATFEKVLSKNNFSRNYCSPTDMGFNVLKQGIINDGLVCEAAKREINFYLFRYRQEFKKGLVSKEVLDRMENVMTKVNISEDYLPTISPARNSKKAAEKQKNKGEKGIYCGAAIELKDGTIITGKNSSLLHAEAAMVLNAIKVLAKIQDNYELISPSVIKQINRLKDQIGEDSHSLDCSEALLALAASTGFNPLALKAQSFLSKLRGCYMHTTHKLSSADESIFRKLGIWVSTDGLTDKH
ncbi:MAG: DUF1846 family protein [Candidatus Shapirobacteria bacterium]|nr:DUF1846 family protein [Candidatus Shapirobacteria bacterium]MDD4410818.1 DUF1846 family protein [Candidatus Shapirobacteria bacterium]